MKPSAGHFSAPSPASLIGRNFEDSSRTHKTPLFAILSGVIGQDDLTTGVSYDPVTQEEILAMLADALGSTGPDWREAAQIRRTTTLAKLLRAAHEQSKLPGLVVAGSVGISESYFSKLLNGHRGRPSRDLLLALGYVWGIRELDEIDQILEAAGHPRLVQPLSQID